MREVDWGKNTDLQFEPPGLSRRVSGQEPGCRKLGVPHNLPALYDLKLVNHAISFIASFLTFSNFLSSCAGQNAWRPQLKQAAARRWRKPYWKRASASRQCDFPASGAFRLVDSHALALRIA